MTSHPQCLTIQIIFEAPLGLTRSVPADEQPAHFDRMTPLSPELGVPSQPLETERGLTLAEATVPAERLMPAETADSEPLRAAERGVPAQPAEPARRSD